MSGEPGSPTKRKSPETTAATETETKDPVGVCPDQVPLVKWYQVVRSKLFDPQDGSPLDYDGLASNAHAIFAGLKRDVDSLTKYVEKNKDLRFPSSIHMNLFRQNVANVRDKIKSILVALYGSSMNTDAVDAELLQCLVPLRAPPVEHVPGTVG